MKIAISGAGVAGPCLAYWLLRTGHEVTLIEKASTLRSGGYIIDFWGLGYSVAERMRILPDVLAAGYKMEEVRLVDAQGARSGGFPAAVFLRMTEGRFTSLPRGDLASIIYRSVADRAETIFGDEIAAIDERADSVCVRLERGGARDFDLLIGADGLHSKVRELTFGPESRFEKELGYYVAAFDVEGYRPRDELVYVAHSLPGRQIARFSQRGDRTMFLFVFRADRLKGAPPSNDEEAKSALRSVFAGVEWECPAILSAMDRVEDIYFDRVSQIRMDVWSKGRVMLIGDAAAAVSLLAGEGTGLAMTEAYELAGELSRAGGDYRAAFKRYEQRLRPFLVSKQKSAASFASSFAPRTAFGVWLRTQATKLLRFPPLADLMVGGSVKDDFVLGDYGM